MSDTKILSTKTVFASRFFKVNRVEIERDGKTFVKDIIDENPFVVILPYTEKGEIYLALEYRDAFKKAMLEVIGGKIPPGEDVLVAAKRELREEAGMNAVLWRHVATWESSPVMKKKMYVYFATDLGIGEQQLEEDEKIELVKLSLSEALVKIEKGEISIGLDVAVILLFDRLRREGKL